MFLKFLEKISRSHPNLQERLEKALKEHEDSVIANKEACDSVRDAASASIVVSKEFEAETKRLIVKKRVESNIFGGVNLIDEHGRLKHG